MTMHRLIHCIYFRVRHFILRLSPWTYGNLGTLLARKHKVFGCVEILMNSDSNTWYTAHSDHWDDFKANK